MEPVQGQPPSQIGSAPPPPYYPPQPQAYPPQGYPPQQGCPQQEYKYPMPEYPQQQCFAQPPVPPVMFAPPASICMQQTSNNVVVVNNAPAVSVTTMRVIPDYFRSFSVFTTVLCIICGGWWALLFTIPAIVCANAARDDDAAGMPASARQKSYIALGLDIAAYLSYIVVLAIIIGAASRK